jgi:hypothetical protein
MAKNKVFLTLVEKKKLTGYSTLLTLFLVSFESISYYIIFKI